MSSDELPALNALERPCIPLAGFTHLSRLRETAAVALMEAATAALEALTVGGGESVLPVISGSRGHSPLALGGSSPVPGAVGASGGAVPAAAAAAPVQIAGGPVAAAGGPVAQPNPENKLFIGGALPRPPSPTRLRSF